MYITCPSNTTTFFKLQIMMIIIIMGMHIPDNDNIRTIVFFSPAQ